MDVSSRRHAFRLDTDENAYFGTARRRSCRRGSSYRRRESSSSNFEVPGLPPASLSGKLSKIDVCRNPCDKERRIASPRDPKVRKAIIALRKQASTGSEENLRREPGWQSARRDIGVGQPTAVLQRFSATALLAPCSALRDRTSGRLFEAHKAKSRLSRIFWHARPRANIQHYTT